MLEQLGLGDWSPQAASVVVGGLIGAAFGILAQRSQFCLRRGLVGAPAQQSNALGTWACALATAIAGTSALVMTGLIDFAEHRFFATSLPLIAIIAGGLLFGAGMYLARGCASRLTVLAGSGNLRALTALVIFAITAHATLKGALAPLRTWAASFEVGLGSVSSLAHAPGGTLFWSALALIALIAVIARSTTRYRQLVMGGLIGALVPLGWLATGYVLADAFDPITHESLAFTSASRESLFWWVAGTAIAPRFGVGLFAGVLAGSLLASLLARDFAVQGFTSETGTGRYLLGGALMGFGGVLAGGCSVGAGLTGVSTLSIAALLALASIITGTIAANALSLRKPGQLLAVPS